jgi:hypothetical protein
LGGGGRRRQYIYSKKTDRKFASLKFSTSCPLVLLVNCWEAKKVKCWKWVILSRKQRRKMSRYNTGAEFYI